VDWTIPDDYKRQGITWPLAGYIPETPEIMFGWERRWPHLPWPTDEGRSNQKNNENDDKEPSGGGMSDPLPETDMQIDSK
jgi:hypothetical protein